MKIEKSIYQGYLWYSGEKEPSVLINKEFELEISENENPFIVEGQLFDGKTSISIKYIDGKYIVNNKTINSSDFNNENFELKEFIPNRIKGVDKLKFLQRWEEKRDDLCENMYTLQPTDLLFVGFKQKED